MQGQFSEEGYPEPCCIWAFASLTLKEFSLWANSVGTLLLSDTDAGVLSPQGRERGERMLLFYAVFHQLIIPFIFQKDIF